MEESRPVPLGELLALVAARGDVAREILIRRRVRVRSGSRLEQASASPRVAAGHGHVDASPEPVDPVLLAVWVAADFADIAAYLPEPLVKSVRQELTVALCGDLWPSRGNRQSLQLQTQHWIGAVLLHAGIEIEHANSSSKSPGKIPEFLLQTGFSALESRSSVRRAQSGSRRRSGKRCRSSPNMTASAPSSSH